MEEIIDAVIYEIENSGYMDKLSAGIVLTGGGAMLKNLNQLVKFKTGLDVRIGYPSECIAADTPEEINQPMYSTSIGLLLKGLDIYKENDEELKVKLLESETGDEEAEELKKPVKNRLQTGKILESLKTTLSDIFDDSDDKM